MVRPPPRHARDGGNRGAGPVHVRQRETVDVDIGSRRPRLGEGAAPRGLRPSTAETIAGGSTRPSPPGSATCRLCGSRPRTSRPWGPTCWRAGWRRGPCAVPRPPSAPPWRTRRGLIARNPAAPPTLPGPAFREPPAWALEQVRTDAPWRVSTSARARPAACARRMWASRPGLHVRKRANGEGAERRSAEPKTRPRARSSGSPGGVLEALAWRQEMEVLVRPPMAGRRHASMRWAGRWIATPPGAPTTCRDDPGSVWRQSGSRTSATCLVAGGVDARATVERLGRAGAAFTVWT